MNIKTALKKYFGYESFKPGQEAIINSIIQGRDALGVLPTGGGKSVCYQIPALLLPGICLVISPLIALMKDQVDALNVLGIPAAFINSAMSIGEIRTRMAEASQGRYKLLYVAPERLASEQFTSLLQKLSISMLAIDEAHCVSQWGHNFRPSYLKIKDLIKRIGNPVVAAFTATANERVQKDIISLLDLSQCRLFIGSFDRPNLEFRIEEPTDPDSYVINYAKSHKGKSGIVYASTRKKVENLYYFLRNNGIKAGMYHAGLTAEQRNRHQDSFINGNTPIMVATNAFGMGIDKSDVRYIIHYSMPMSIESYYQEAGRAGRDGEKSVCILLRNSDDYKLNKFILSGNYPPVKAVENLFNRVQKRKISGIPTELILSRKAAGSNIRESALRKVMEYGYVHIRNGIVFPTDKDVFELTQEEIDKHKQEELAKLDTMDQYFEEETCLRSYILRYFNEEPESEHCGNCSVCYRSEGKDSTLMSIMLSHIFGK